MKVLLKYLFVVNLLLHFLPYLEAHTPTKDATNVHRKQLQNLVAPHCVAIPEGGFVYYFHPKVYPWLENRIDLQTIKSMRKEITPYLKIPLTKEGFTMASTRRLEDEIDETSYSAIWVRDTCWHYFGLKIGDREDAKRIILSLLKFYSTKNQVKRFVQVITNPETADPIHNPNAYMSVPLIRFSRKTLHHHQVNDEDQVWNHLQFDSHGLFLLVVSDALKSNIITAQDLSSEYYAALSLFPAFFSQTEYWIRKDSGPWEEELMNNASSIGLMAAGLKGYKEDLLGDATIEKNLMKASSELGVKYGYQSSAKSSGSSNTSSLKQIVQASLKKDAIDDLYQKGLKRVEFNLSLGGEAPDINKIGVNRRADAALLFLCVPDNSLFSTNKEKSQTILNIVLDLVAPYGVFRYKTDAYQALNYWIDHAIASDIQGKKTPDLEFVTRFHKGYMPGNQPFDAQWFFDSIIATVYYNLSEMMESKKIQEYYLTQGDVHLKRAIGQFTGPNAYAANGEKLAPMSLPESINTVFTLNYLFKPMPSPICPLSWSTAAMRIALQKAENAHSYFEMGLADSKKKP